MDHHLSVVRRMLFLGAVFLLPQIAWCAHGRGTLVVGNDKSECPNAAFARIQDAIDVAGPGDEIRICKGIYPEQLTIGTPLKIQGDPGATLLPTQIQANTSSLVDSSPIAAAILVENASFVSISGLITDGANNGISECSPNLIGVLFQNASGRITESAIRNFKLPPFLAGCQSGSGIVVQSGAGQVSKVEIADNSVHDFQKNGITGDELGTFVSIHGNVVTGAGPTSGAAQNGIQIGFGAQGTITHNHVTNNLWSPCTDVTTCQAVATNILVVQSDSVEVSDNHVGLSQIPIYVIGNRAKIAKNEAFAVSVFDGVRLEGDAAEIVSNRIFNGAQSGIFLMGNNSLIIENTITEAPVGLFEASGSQGNLHFANHFFDTTRRVHDPVSASLAAMIQPQR
jgi:Periplasmic copper-binding protein (NosD)